MSETGKKPGIATRGSPAASSRLRVVLEPDIAIGPGKADILEGIRDTGSIAAAGRRMGMSYKRAWMLVDTMNDAFKLPVVETSRGGAAHGGAKLTATGETVLACYREMQDLTDQAIKSPMARLRTLLSDMSDRK